MKAEKEKAGARAAGRPKGSKTRTPEQRAADKAEKAAKDKARDEQRKACGREKGKNNRGRVKLYTPKQLEDKINEYWADESYTLHTDESMAAYLGIDQTTLREYEKDTKCDYSAVLKNARARRAQEILTMVTTEPKLSIAYGVITGAVEAGTEKLFGGNPVFDSDKAGFVNRVIAKAGGSAKLLKFLDSVPVETFNEGLEEIIANYGYTVAQELTGQKATLPTAQENIGSFAGGVALGGIGQAVNAATNHALQGRAGTYDTLGAINQEAAQPTQAASQENAGGCNFTIGGNCRAERRSASRNERAQRYQ